MAENYTNFITFLNDVADAIRLKSGSSAHIIAKNFPEEIKNLQIKENNEIKISVGNTFSSNAYYKDYNNNFSYINSIGNQVNLKGVMTLSDMTLDDYYLNIGISLEKAQSFFIPGIYSFNNTINNSDEINPDKIITSGLSLYGIKDENNNWCIYSAVQGLKINSIQTKDNLLILNSTDGEIINSNYTTTANSNINNGFIPIPLFTILNDMSGIKSIDYQSKLYNYNKKAFLPDIYITYSDKIFIDEEDLDNENSTLIGTGEIA